MFTQKNETEEFSLYPEYNRTLLEGPRAEEEQRPRIRTVNLRAKGRGSRTIRKADGPRRHKGVPKIPAGRERQWK